MLKKVLFFLVSLVAGTVLFITVVDWQEFRSALSIFTGWHVLVILLLTALMFFIGAWKWMIILKNQGYSLEKKEIFKLYLAGFSLSYLFPLFIGGGTGTIFRGYVLREKFFVPWKKGIVSLIIEKFLEISIGLLVILAGLIFFLSKRGIPSGNIGAPLLLGIIVLTAFFVFLYVKFFRSESIVGFFAKFFSKKHFVNGTALEIEQDIFDFFEPKKPIFWKVVGLAFLRVAVIGLRSWILVLFLGQFLTFFSIFPIMAFYFMALYIPVPAMLGTHEIAQTFAFGSLGVEAGLAAAFTMIQRGAELLFAFIGLLIFFKLGFSLIRSIFSRKIDTFIR